MILTIEAIGSAYHAWKVSKELPCDTMALQINGCGCEAGKEQSAAYEKLMSLLREAETLAEAGENSYQDEIEKRLYQVTHSRQRQSLTYF